MKRCRQLAVLCTIAVLGLLLTACTAQPSSWRILFDGVEADTIRYTPGTVNYQVAVVERDGAFGLIDYQGETVTSVDYETIELKETAYGSGVTMLAGYRSDNPWCCYFEADGSLSSLEPSAWGYESTCYVYWQDGNVVEWGSGDGSATNYVEDWHPQTNLLGNITLTPPRIVAVQEMKGYTTNEYGETVVDLVSENYALLDYETKTLLTDFIYEDRSSIGFTEGVLPVKKNGKWGYVNEKGEELTPFIYDVSELGEDGRWNAVRMYGCTNGYIVVRQGDRWGLIDNTGETIVEVRYHGISQVNDKGQFWIKQGDCWALAQINA